MDFENKRIVILGGTSGIGLAVAQAAAAQGARGGCQPGGTPVM